MKKFIATCNKWAGQVTIVYDDDNKLVTVNYLGASLSPRNTEIMQTHIPVTYTEVGFNHFAERGNLTIIASDFEVSFDQFWNAYDVKFNRKRCEGHWGRMSKADRVKAWATIAAYQQHLARNPWKNKAHPDTYLSERYYDTDWKTINS